MRKANRALAAELHGYTYVAVNLVGCHVSMKCTHVHTCVQYRSYQSLWEMHNVRIRSARDASLMSCLSPYTVYHHHAACHPMCHYYLHCPLDDTLHYYIRTTKGLVSIPLTQNHAHEQESRQLCRATLTPPILQSFVKWLSPKSFNPQLNSEL